jgi:hypothetical protein
VLSLCKISRAGESVEEKRGVFSCWQRSVRRNTRIISQKHRHLHGEEAIAIPSKFLPSSVAAFYRGGA